MYKHKNAWKESANPSPDAHKTIIMIHGRGANAEDIMSLSNYLQLKDFNILAPEATQSSWYPYSFMAPRDANEPALSSALALIDQKVHALLNKGVKANDIFFLGFSQGACLSLEYAASSPADFGGIIAFSGGLIGEKLELERYQGSLRDVPVFIGCSDQDPHIPLERVKESTNILSTMGASVNEKIYPGMPHTIIQEEIDIANKMLSL